MSTRISAFVHLDSDPGATFRLSQGTFASNCLHMSDSQGNEVYVFLGDTQLAALDQVIGERLAAMPTASNPDCICIHLAGDNERCVVHRAAAPDLLEALEVALNTVECASIDVQTGADLPWYTLAKRAIVKAQGREVAP